MVTLTVDPQIRAQASFCTMQLTVKFHRPTFNCSEVIVQTNRQTDDAENIHLASLCCANG